jgi:catechol 2,3-dioxygenase-like lactoylglutathione lyase family enzyme
VPPTIKQIAEVALIVSDLERSRRFYRDVLGLKEFEHPAIKPDAGVTFHLGNGYIGLWLPGKWLGPVTDLGGKAHVVFYIDPDEEEEALATLRTHQVTFWGPRYNEHGELHIDFEDPDGHMLEYWGRRKW